MTQPQDQLGVSLDRDRATVFFLPISHLDTQWRWTVRDTIAKFLPKTLSDHRHRFDRFPSYCVNFDGAFRYALIEEYDPEGFADLTQWVADGRLRVSGAFWDAADVNVPSPESLIRQCLYGSLYFRQRFGVTPSDIFLPDCFGFGAQLPIVAAHCGLVGFTSSKLRRDDWMRSSVGIPFPIGVWEGPDGSELVCALDPGGYGAPLTRTPAEDDEIVRQIEEQRELSNQRWSVRYFGIGDKGGAPGPDSLEVLERAVADESITTRAVGSSALFRHLHRHRESLPRHRGDILLTTHGTGCYTAHAAMKRGNHANELLAEAAEKAASAASWLGGMRYPTEELRQAWQLMLWHQFHDDLTGTSLPAAYDISWNDLALAANRFQEILNQAVGTVAAALDTETEGIPLVVFNPLSQPRTDLVVARLDASAEWRSVRVLDPDGAPCRAQLETGDQGEALVVFSAELPPLGFAVFDVTGGPEIEEAPSDGLGLREQDNGRYRIRLDDRGDLAELYDHKLERDLLGGPTRLQLLHNHSVRFPAWEIQHEDVARVPMAQVRGPSTSRLLARGPARVVVETRRQAKGSTFVQRLRLAHGTAGDRVEVESLVDWRTRGALLKAAFPLAATAPTALYDRGVTAVEHGVNHPQLYEVPAQQWALQRSRGQDEAAWGTAVLSRARYGWDKPDDQTLRLTLLHTPRVGRRFRHQGVLDIGRHRMEWALFGFQGGGRPVVPWAAARFNQPPLPFVVARSAGQLGRRWSFFQTSGDSALVRTVKRAEEGSELVVRLHEVAGQGRDLSLEGAADITAARSLTGTEQPLPLTPPAIANGALQLELRPSEPQTIGIELEGSSTAVSAVQSRPIELHCDWNVVSRQNEPNQAGLDGGVCFPAELWPRSLAHHGVEFKLAAPGVYHQQAVRARGQRLGLDSRGLRADRLHLLCCARQESRSVTLRVGDVEHQCEIASALRPLHHWDRVHQGRARWLRQLQVEPGSLRTDPVAWFATHTHDRRGRDRPYHFAYLFHLAVPWSGGDLRLPEDEDVLLIAVTLADDGRRVAHPAASSFDGNLVPETLFFAAREA